jgi:diguanylate cyclase (GGDEF)-like protein
MLPSAELPSPRPPTTPSSTRPRSEAHPEPCTKQSVTAALDELEHHRSIDVRRRLQGAQVVEQQAVAVGSPHLQQQARLVQADMLQRIGQMTTAARMVTDVNRWATIHGPAALLSRSHMVLSTIFVSVGDPASALDHALRAVELLDVSTDERTRGNFLLWLGDALSVAQSFDAARHRYREAEAVFVGIGDVERQLGVLNNLAFSQVEASQVRAAWETSQRMRRLAMSSGIGLNPAFLDTLARTHIALDEIGLARHALLEGLQALDECGDVQAETPAELLLSLAEVQRRAGDIEASRHSLDECRRICQERSLTGIEVEVMRIQAELHAEAGEFEQAYRLFTFYHDELVKLTSARRDAAARTRQALFETAQAREEAQRFRQQARTDPLTGLYNRRFVDEELPGLLDDVASGAAVVVAILDADRFKSINDDFSHETGDQVIRALADLLSGAVSPGGEGGTHRGFAARLGGEEFLLVLQGFGLRRAVSVLDHVRSRVQRHDWSRLGDGLHVTVSIGAVAAAPGDTASAVLSRADRHLYAAKAAGRNQVCC